MAWSFGEVHSAVKESRFILKRDSCAFYRFSLRIKAYAPPHVFRVAIIISKKIEKSACARNYMRRRLKDALRKASFYTLPADVFVFVHKPFSRAAPSTLLDEIVASGYARAVSLCNQYQSNVDAS